ncbi:hypothetical protein JavanS250_0018 [Streptococcus satellite phage Javan250]|nr:hypothetical protein JavanS250_0018 [Streptococcus satellite phage Javan250]
MEIKVMSLTELLDNLELTIVQNLLETFKGFTTPTSTPHDVEVFLHSKAITFEKSGVASTYLLFNQETKELVGFFSLANKPLIFSKKDFQALSKSKQKAFNKHGRRLESGGHQVNSYLIGQLGKNFGVDSPVSGVELLTFACQKIQEAARIINTRYIWIECDNNPKLLQFYQGFGFTLIEPFNSESGLKVLVLKIKK